MFFLWNNGRNQLYNKQLNEDLLRNTNKRLVNSKWLEMDIYVNWTYNFSVNGQIKLK